MIGYGENIQCMRPLLVKDLLIGFGTSEIYSSEKFYTLLKDLKSKGVLIEEASWNRLSQLTCGASHQGVALQLACSKTISLDKLIVFSKNILLILLFLP